MEIPSCDKNDPEVMKEDNRVKQQLRLAMIDLTRRTKDEPDVPYGTIADVVVHLYNKYDKLK